ncbi:CLUMA_CG005855, isoform A [Clunio marinus]|uniref:CLUMA_CG005855, isoform A n=1 Tax=Clunio marinus TaxID=568069 RepID=A0A1J1HW50_9DIPT|nr:CLUMA_CG005855, isoform A [Clunio marinus]
MKNFFRLLIFAFVLSAVTVSGNERFFKSLYDISPNDFYEKVIEATNELANRTAYEAALASSNPYEVDEGILNFRCLASIAIAFFTVLNNTELWAVEIVDSWSKIQSGILMGNLLNMGHYDQCLRVNHSLLDFDQDLPVELDLTFYEGMHCVVRIAFPIPDSIEYPPEVEDLINSLGLGLDFSMCVPKVCPIGTFKTLAEFIFGDLIGLPLINRTVEEQALMCHSTESTPLSWLEIGAIVLVSVLAGLVVLSTAYDLICRVLNIDRNRLLQSYSAYTNGRALFSMRTNKEHIRCLYGIRCLSLIWLLMGYRYYLTMLVFPINAVDFVTVFADSAFSTIVFTSQLGIDTLLLVTATVLAYTFYNQMQRTGRFSVLGLYLHWYLRVAPILAVSIFLFLTLVQRLGEGPYHTSIMQSQVPQCEEYWWSALLFVQNYVNPTQMCLIHTYYLSIEMQLIWASPLLLFPLYFWRKWVVWVAPALVLLTIFYTNIVAFWFDFRAFIVLNPLDKLADFLRLVYFPTHARMGPFLIGISLGYFLGKMEKRKIKMYRTVEVLLWLLAISIAFLVVFIHHPFQQFVDNFSTSFGNQTYLAFHRNVFAVCIAWIIFACHNGSGYFVNWILSRPIWKPLFRMGLVFYITHLGLIIGAVASLKAPTYFGNSEVLSNVTSDFVGAFIVATVAYLAVQAPILRIERCFYSLFDDANPERGNENEYEKAKWYKSFI